MKKLKQTFKLMLAAIATMLASCGGGDKNIASVKLIPVKMGEQFQYVDIEGKIVINPQFKEASIFRNGLALVQTSGENPKWGFIGEDGKFTIAASYVSATVFEEDLAWVVSENAAPTCINTKGEIKFILKNAKVVHTFSDGLAGFKEVNKEGEVKWGFVDKTGKVIINTQFASIGTFVNGKCPVSNKEGKWGFIDKQGKILINYQFDNANSFFDGFAVVKSDNKAGVIDESGKYKINPQFSGIQNDGNLFLINQDNKYGWADKEGKIIINPQFESAFPFTNNNLAAVQSGNSFGYIDKEGKIVINPQFDMALPFNGKLAVVVSSDKIGFIDNEGKYVINPQFDGVSKDLIEYFKSGNSYYNSVSSYYVETVDTSAITNEINNAVKQAENTLGTANQTSNFSPKDLLLGTWTGEMGGKKITIVINNISGNIITGYNQVGSNKRDLKGSFTEIDGGYPCSKTFETTLKEPGDDKWDGVFTINFMGFNGGADSDCSGPFNATESTGVWLANNGKSTKQLSLTKQK